MSAAAAAAAAKKKTGPSIQEIQAGFNRLREEQRAIIGKISELEAEKNEHAIVIETLKETDGDRTGYRMLNGVLVQHKVKEIIPALQHNYEQLGKAVELLKTQLSSKGAELVAYRERHNIRIQGEPQRPPASEAQKEGAGDEEKSKEGKSEGVLVS